MRCHIVSFIVPLRFTVGTKAGGLCSGLIPRGMYNDLPWATAQTFKYLIYKFTSVRPSVRPSDKAFCCRTGLSDSGRSAAEPVCLIRQFYGRTGLCYILALRVVVAERHMPARS